MLEELRNGDLSPYRNFSRSDWSKLRADTPMTLLENEVTRLQSMGDPVSLAEVETIYLPISRLLSFHVEALQHLHHATETFLGTNEQKMPFMIGIAGSVAVGKSTTARILQELLIRWPSSPKVELITTDGFLLTNAQLQKDGIMNRKGFPESYNLQALLKFLSDIKAGKRNVRAPVYSHLAYDIVPNMQQTVDQPDILILEGLNVLQTRTPPRDGKAVPFVSDFFDFSIYLDADEAVLEKWYVERFMTMRETRFTDPQSYFHEYAKKTPNEALEIANNLWNTINLANLHENIRPTRPRANLILHKSEDHGISDVSLRRL